MNLFLSFCDDSEVEKLAKNENLIKELAKNCMKPKGHADETIIKDWEKLIFQDL